MTTPKTNDIELVKWDVRCKASSIANDFINPDLEPVFVIGLEDVKYNPEHYPNDFDTNLPVAYVRLADPFSTVFVSLASTGYVSGKTLSIKFNKRIVKTSPKNGELRVSTIQVAKP
jgi:hypothetical protein